MDLLLVDLMTKCCDERIINRFDLGCKESLARRGRGVQVSTFVRTNLATSRLIKTCNMLNVMMCNDV